MPAESINLILDNLAALITKCGGTPNSVSPSQLADLVTHLAQAGKLILRDANGRAKVAAPEADDDIARKAEISAARTAIEASIAQWQQGIETQVAQAGNSPTGYGLYREGRNLLDVLGVTTVADAMAALRERLNNGESAADGEPDFEGLEFGDYIDGLTLSAGSVHVPWNPNYKNTRIVLSGLNQYKGAGDTENAKNHILFTFRHCLTTSQMKTTNDNSGGYQATLVKTLLEGDMKAALQNAIGDYIYPVRRILSTKGGWGWATYTVFLPTEREVFGCPVWGEVDYDGGFQGQFPIFQKSAEYLVKRLNGSRQWYWLATPYSGSSSYFCVVSYYGSANNLSASSAGGLAPAFCVA